MITPSEARQLRRETSLLGQLDVSTAMYDNYMPEEISEEQALQNGLSIITNPQTLQFRHNAQIYIKPELKEKNDSF